MSSAVNSKLSTIPEAIEAIKAGEVVIVVDDENRENEGDFVAAAELITPETINFMATHGRGLLCTPIPEDICDRLDLQPMVSNNTDPKKTAFTVSIDLLGDGVSTGISASDRAKTILALMNDESQSKDFARPGHIFPLRAKTGGVLRRPGHTEAAIDLSKLAGLKAGGVIVEIMNEDGSMARLPDLMQIADKFDLKLVSIEDLIEYRLQNESLITLMDSYPVKTYFGDFTLHAYQQTTNQQIHFALTYGEWTVLDEVPVRVKATNTYYDLFSSLQSGETPLLQEVTDIIKAEGKGVIVFINNVTDTDILMAKLDQFKKYLRGESQHASLPMDEKDYGIGAQIIRELGINKIKLITRNPQQNYKVEPFGFEITGHIQISLEK